MAILLAAPAAQGQVAIGNVPFSSQASYQFDTINTSNLNVMFAVPVVTRAGRGRPFTYSLSYNGSLWSPTNAYGQKVWTPISGWGWGAGSSTANPGYATATWGQSSCTDDNFNTFYWDTWVYQNYYDSSGTVHPIVADTWGDLLILSDYAESGADCDNPLYFPDNALLTLNDGSGYTMQFWYDGGGIFGTTVWDRSGNWTTVWPQGYGGNSGTVTDPNGNAQSFSTSGNTTTFTDTLGTVLYDYGGSTFVADGNQIGFNYSTSLFEVKTNFGCSGVTEYASSWQNLVTEIDLPDTNPSAPDKYTFTYEQTPGYPGYTTARLKSVTLPGGGTITYTYSGGSNGVNCSDGSTPSMTRQVNDANGNNSTWTYARTENSSSAWTTNITDPANTQTVINFVVPATGPAYTGNPDGIAYETERTITNSSNTLMKTVNTCYNGSSISCVTTPITMPISKQTAQVIMPALSGSPSQTTTDYNTYGLTTETDESNYGPTLVRKTITTYACLNSQDPYICDRPSQVEIVDNGGNPQANTTYVYDTKGNLTQETRSTSSLSATISRSFTYTSNGVLQTATDFLNSTNQEISVTGYTCNNNSVFPSATNLPASLSESTSWNCSLGLPQTTYDVNDNGTNFTYDTMQRPTLVSYPDNGSTTITYTNPNLTDVESAVTYSSSRHDQVGFDGLGRVITNALVNDPDGETYVTTKYDGVGRVAYVSNPYRSSPPGVGDSYQYDALDRVTQVTHADSSYALIAYGTDSQSCSSSTYGLGYSTLYTDEAGNLRQIFTDALGRVIEADEPTASSNSLSVSTCYKYNALNDLKEVDQGSESRYYSYDMLGRLTQESTPESKGNTRYYSYATSGGLCAGDASAVCSRTDERGITTTYTYDPLNRPGSNPSTPAMSYSSGDPSVYYLYDQTSYNGLTILNGKGRRTGMSDGSGQTAWSYDPMGRVASEERTIAGWTNPLYYSYNLDGSLATVMYPRGRSVTYTPSAVGRPVSAVNGNGISYVTSATYAPQGTLATADYYNSAITFSVGYNSNRSCPTRLQASASSTFFELEPSYNTNGTVSGVTNALTSGRTQNYTYDYLNRLITAQTTATTGTYCWGQGIPTNGTGYDRYGNLQTINVTRCSAPALNLSVNNYNQITNSGYSYDNSGNMTFDGSNNYTWTGESQLKSAASINYTYDGDGKRVEKSTATRYWFIPDGLPLAETDWAGNTTEYIYFNGARVAWRDPSGNIYYYFSDQIGTTQLIYNATSGAVCFDSDNSPFGYEMVYTSNCAQEYEFAGMELDSETGNYHTWFRNYEPNLGRWMTPDPIGRAVATPTNPQTWNRYSYALNNPTTLTDPLGLFGTIYDYGDNGDGGGCSGDGGHGRGSNGQGSTQPPEPSGGTKTPANNGKSPCISMSSLNWLQKAQLTAAQTLANLTGGTFGFGAAIDAGIGVGPKGSSSNFGAGGSASTLIVADASGNSGILNSVSGGGAFAKMSSAGSWWGGGVGAGPSMLISGYSINHLAGPSISVSAGGGTGVLGGGFSLSTSGSLTITAGTGVGAELGVSPQVGTSQFIPFCHN